MGLLSCLAPAGIGNKLVGQEPSKANKHLSPAGSRKKLQGQEPYLGNKLLKPCRIEEKDLCGRSHPRARSFSDPARMRNKASEAGAIPDNKASHTLLE